MNDQFQLYKVEKIKRLVLTLLIIMEFILILDVVVAIVTYILSCKLVNYEVSIDVKA